MSDDPVGLAAEQLALARADTDLLLRHLGPGPYVVLARVLVASVRELAAELRLLTVEERERDRQERRP